LTIEIALVLWPMLASIPSKSTQFFVGHAFITINPISIKNAFLEKQFKLFLHLKK
jgi:hypothetical protein